MSDKANRAYLEWLEPQVRPKGGHKRGHEYWDLLELLRAKEFIWFVPNDDNRIADALALREMCFYDLGVKPYITTDILGPCSVLEIIISLGQRMEFQIEGHIPASEWAWGLIVNLELQKMWDPLSNVKRVKIDKALDRFIWRTYHLDGQGGMFPLAWPNENQQRVELWYQMHAWIEELHEP